MNRYQSGGPSKATATTQCQKCLKRGHYSYECSATQQERPYVSRPSRTQQLLNPRLAPKVSSPPPKSDATKRYDSTDVPPAKDAKKSTSHGSHMSPAQRRGSVSSYSSASVSTISTNVTQSKSRGNSVSRRRRSISPRREDRSLQEGEGPRSQSICWKHSPASRDPAPARRLSKSPRRERTRSRSRSPLWSDRHYKSSRTRSPFDGQHERSSPAQQAQRRSLSPYSKRMALSKDAASHSHF